jgi:hypothetical protein
MSGALLQLAGLSSQDIYLTSNPKMTLFKKTFLRYTNFAQETVQISFDGGISTFGQTSTATLPYTGDLISKVVLVVQLEQIQSTTKWGYVDRLGHALIDNIRANVGSSDIDIQHGDWIDIYQRMTKDKSQEDNYNKMIGNVSDLKNIGTNHSTYTLYIPLEIWTGKITTSAFPICALTNQQFQISIKFRDAIDIINYYGTELPPNEELPIISSSYLLVDYIFLETDDVNLFKTTNLDYLIEVVQDMTDMITSTETKINLIFDKPTKYLLWYIILDRYANRNTYMTWASDNNWEKTREEFAKLIWLITRDGLDASDVLNPIIYFNDVFVNIGQVPPIISGGSKMFEKLAKKVDGIILFAENIVGQIGAKATIDNVILTKNEITFEDMSTTNDEFKEDTFITIQQLNFLNIHTYNIIDIFNYGNFINRTDNPIIKSSFQLNGKNRFQERDGFFYNYVQPYYYFPNSPPDGVNTYSFSLHPTEIQPSGIINLGYVSSKDLIVKLGIYNNNSDTYFNNIFKSGKIRIFACVYNVIKIYNGLVSLSY